MIGATPSIFSEIRKEKITPKRVILAIIGLVFPIAISIIFANICGLNTSSLFENFPFYIHILAFITGEIVATTQIIPGLSVTFFNVDWIF